MKISIITVCFNSASTLQTAMDSVLGQTYPDIEYIVIDGGSRDGTKELLERYRVRLAVCISEPDEGIYDAINKGLSRATGDVVAILNSDDVYSHPDAVAQVVEAFKANPEADMVCGDIVFVDSTDLERVTRYYNVQHFEPWMLRFGWMPAHPGAFVKRHLYRKLQGYRKDYRISGDYEFFVRALLVHKAKLVKIAAVLVSMRSGGVSTSGLRSTLLLNQEIVRACRENGVYTNLALVLSKMPFKVLELVRRPGYQNGV